MKKLLLQLNSHHPFYQWQRTRLWPKLNLDCQSNVNKSGWEEKKGQKENVEMKEMAKKGNESIWWAKLDGKLITCLKILKTNFSEVILFYFILEWFCWGGIVVEFSIHNGASSILKSKCGFKRGNFFFFWKDLLIQIQ